MTISRYFYDFLILFHNFFSAQIKKHIKFTVDIPVPFPQFPIHMGFVMETAKNLPHIRKVLCISLY